MKQESPNTLEELIQTLTPPKGIRRNFEGYELFDGDEIEPDDGIDSEVESDVDDENLQNNPFKSLMTDKTAKRLQATFRALDTDNSGLISAQNLADALTSSKQFKKGL